MPMRAARQGQAVGRGRALRSVAGIFADTYSFVFSGIHAPPAEDTWETAGEDIAFAWRTVGGDLRDAVDAYQAESARITSE